MRLSFLTVVLLASRVAGADAGDTARSVGEAAGYGIPAIGAAITTFANGTALAYGETSPFGWRVAGWVLGGIEVAIGTGLLVTTNDTTVEVALGVVPVVLGVSSLATATFVDSEERIGVAVAPWAVPGGAGVGVGGSFP